MENGGSFGGCNIIIEELQFDGGLGFCNAILIDRYWRIVLAMVVVIPSLKKCKSNDIHGVYNYILANEYFVEGACVAVMRQGGNIS